MSPYFISFDTSHEKLLATLLFAVWDEVAEVEEGVVFGALILVLLLVRVPLFYSFPLLFLIVELSPFVDNIV